MIYILKLVLYFCVESQVNDDRSIVQQNIIKWLQLLIQKLIYFQLVHIL